MKMTAAILVSIFLLIRSAMNFPKYTAIIDTKVRAIMVPQSTITALYLVANNAEAICVLSPHSANRIRRNPEINALL